MHTLIIAGLALLEVGALLILIFHFFSGVTSALYGAPYVPMRGKFLSGLLSFGEVSSSDVFCDLGSGDGRVLLRAVKEYKVKEAIGYDISPWAYTKSQWRIRRSGYKNITVHYENIFNADLSRITCLYCYLMPALMDRLGDKLSKELQLGARIIVPSFPIDLIKYPALQLKKSQKIGTITAYLYEKI